MFGFRHALQIFRRIVGSVYVTVVNFVAVGNVAVVVPENCAVKFGIFEVVIVLAGMINNVVEQNVLVVDLHNRRRRN